MSRPLALAVLGFVVVAAGCRRAVDVTAEEHALLQVDRAWAAVTATRNVDSILSYWTDDARVLVPGQPIVSGQQALRGMVTGMLSAPGFQLSWTPDSAVVATSGDLGYTFGQNSVTAPDATGKLVRTVGRYITIWRKGVDGRWRCSEDISNAGPLGPAGS